MVGLLVYKTDTDGEEKVIVSLRNLSRTEFILVRDCFIAKKI